VKAGFLEGAHRLARGVRTQNVGMATVGAAMVAIAIIRSTARPKRELVAVKKVKPGRAIRVEVEPAQPTR
jgi:hypothetical protein